MSARPPPSGAVLAASRRRHRVPAHFVWRWCSNPNCTDFAWVDGEAVALTERLGMKALAACSAKCSKAILESNTVDAIVRGGP